MGNILPSRVSYLEGRENYTCAAWSPARRLGTSPYLYDAQTEENKQTSIGRREVVMKETSESRDVVCRVSESVCVSPKAN